LAQTGASGNGAAPPTTVTPLPIPQSAPSTNGAVASETSLTGLLSREIKPKHSEEDYLQAEQIMAFHEAALKLQNPTSDIAEEFAASLRLARKIYSRKIYIPAADERLTFIFDSLLAQTPLLVLARDARLQLQLEVYSKSGWVSRALARISDGSSTGLVLTALVASTVIWTAVALLVYSAVHRSTSDWRPTSSS
jgi:hypothetical protein